jgi:hypothetical protein
MIAPRPNCDKLPQIRYVLTLPVGASRHFGGSQNLVRAALENYRSTMKVTSFFSSPPSSFPSSPILHTTYPFASFLYRNGRPSNGSTGEGSGGDGEDQRSLHAENSALHKERDVFHPVAVVIGGILADTVDKISGRQPLVAKRTAIEGIGWQSA